MNAVRRAGEDSFQFSVLSFQRGRPAEGSGEEHRREISDLKSHISKEIRGTSISGATQSRDSLTASKRLMRRLKVESCRFEEHTAEMIDPLYRATVSAGLNSRENSNK